MASIQDLAMLIQSRYPLIAAETVEENRFEKALEQVTDSLRMPYFLWSLTDGLRRVPSLGAVYETHEPLKALTNIAGMTGESLFFMKDLHRFLEKPEIVRKLQDLAPHFTMDRRVIVLLAAKDALPAPLQSLAAPFTFELPSPAELKQAAKALIERVRKERPLRVELTDADMDHFVERLKGMTAFEAERALSQAIVRDNGLTPKDLDIIVEIKKELLRRDGLLEYIAPEENLNEVGGFATLKAWLAKRKRAFEPAAKEFGLVPPKGILLLGVQGCLRGDTRVLLSDGRMPTFESLARQASDCLEPGVYDVAWRVALEDGTSALATKLQIHESRATLLIRFADGRELEATPDHQVLTVSGWRRADQLEPGDEVRLWNRPSDGFTTPPKRTGFDRPLHSVRLRKVPVEVLPELWSPELAELIGLVAAEGNQDRYRVTITLSSDEIELAAWLRARSEKLFGILPAERSRPPKRVREFRFNSFDVAVNLHPLIAGSHRTKRVPDPIFHLDDACVAGFVRGLFEGDGCVTGHERTPGSHHAPRVALKTVSAAMAHDVQQLLQRLGIHSTVRFQEKVYGYSRYPCYTVELSSRTSIERFATTVGFLTDRKQSRLVRGIARYQRHTKPRSAGAARVVAVDGGRCLNRVYDLTVPVAERFIANGLVVHNCGKTLVAKAVANQWNMPLLKMEPGRLYDKYIGESDKNLEKALRMAEAMAPCVLMIDEIEKGLAYSQSTESDGGLSRRIFGRLIGWLQDRKAPVFVIATSNAIAQLPPELTRKGRFDEIFFIDLPTREERKDIFAIHLKKRKRDPANFDLDHLATASDGFTGAEIEAVVMAALYSAFSRNVELSTTILAEELRSTKPLSVTRAEEVEELRTWARERTVRAS